ncbi:hypothetical protein FA13DRAFT_1648715 [Coprinellus micaceus]|uniref:PPPDE domain-containing protein n=1 Tax=Coprinellus micaceus TaxID=71717 RepID=A0A4Y7SA93_COPMI|nr:hypothetical protein FA13DRAFT_1648715 [Coprinellus micaceus]
MRPLKPLLEKFGVGRNPDVVPSGSGSTHEQGRPVTIYSHPVLGTLARGREASMVLVSHTEAPPDPRRHWAVQVGDFFHELNVDHNFNNVYQNGRVDQTSYKWERFTVGWTKYDDAAIKDAGEWFPRLRLRNGTDSVDPQAEEVIKHMKPVYDVYDNNCQKFTIGLLNVICEPGREKVTTSYSYIAQTKMGFQIPFLSHESPAQHTQEIELPARDEVAAKASSIMDEHTPRLDPKDLGTIGVHHETGEPVLVHLL